MLGLRESMHRALMGVGLQTHLLCRLFLCTRGSLCDVFRVTTRLMHDVIVIMSGKLYVEMLPHPRELPLTPSQNSNTTWQPYKHSTLLIYYSSEAN